MQLLRVQDTLQGQAHGIPQEDQGKVAPLRCSVILPFRNERTAEAILGSVSPERNSGGSKRNSVSLSRRGADIDLEITSEDITSMRAAVNSYLRWFILAKRVTEITGDD